MKSIVLSFLILAFSSLTFAGDGGTVIANLEKGGSLQTRNTIVPPRVKEQYEYYEVCGCCEADVKHSLKQKCISWNDGKKYDAVTSWKMKWDYGRNQDGQACTADSFTVTVDITYRLPKWAKSADAPQQLADKWETYEKNLTMHESGHRDRAVDAAAELTKAVAELSPSRTCAELDRDVKALASAEMKKLDFDQKQYDIDTAHGATQGAVFP